MLFTLTDRALTIPSSLRGCQSGTWFSGKYHKKGTITPSTCQKKIEAGHSIERFWYNSANREPSITPPPPLRTLRVSGFSKGTVDTLRESSYIYVNSCYSINRHRTLTIPYFCTMYGHTYSKSMDQPGKVVSPARGQLNRKNESFPVCVRA